MAIKLTYYRVTQIAEAIIERVGFEYFYSPGSGLRCNGMSCFNWITDGNGKLVPSCIVGTILHEIGIPLESMSPGADSGSLIASLVDDEIIDQPSQEVIDFLWMAQVLQDNGATWHSAVKGAGQYARKMAKKNKTIDILNKKLEVPARPVQ